MGVNVFEGGGGSIVRAILTLTTLWYFAVYSYPLLNSVGNGFGIFQGELTS
jgi:hypothetical protein